MGSKTAIGGRYTSSDPLFGPLQSWRVRALPCARERWGFAMVVKFRTPSGSEPDTDGLLKWMRRYNIPITRENYLKLAYKGAYMGTPPVGLTLEEEEEELPPELRRK
jgi:hypothetical protein